MAGVGTVLPQVPGWLKWVLQGLPMSMSKVEGAGAPNGEGDVPGLSMLEVVEPGFGPPQQWQSDPRQCPRDLPGPLSVREC
jgi:hypothetical protein